MHRLCEALLAWNTVGLGAVALWAAAWGPNVLWLSDIPELVAVTPGGRHEWMVAETLAAVLCLLLAGLWLGPGQYLVIDVEQPLVDAWLATADAVVGIHVPSLAQWTVERPWIDRLLWSAYGTLLAVRVRATSLHRGCTPAVRDGQKPCVVVIPVRRRG